MISQALLRISLLCASPALLANAAFAAVTNGDVPGTFDAEDFDQGGEGVGYHDNTPSNQGDAGYRTGESVDVFVSNDASSGRPYVVKNFEAGEWLAYTINVADGGNYDIEVRASTHPAFPNSAYHVEIDGTNATGTVVLPDTGGWENYQWVGKGTVALTSGTHLLRLVSEQPYFSLNSIRLSTTVPSTPYSGAPHAVPTEIEAERFDAGGQGIAYHDNAAGNQGDAGYRLGEDVDIFFSNDAYSDDPYIVKNFEAGEWLAYTISVPTSGNYVVELRASTHPAFPDPAYHVEIDGTNVTGTVVLPDTGGWDVYQWAGKRMVTLTAGTHALKLVSERPYVGLNALRVSRMEATWPTIIPSELEAEGFDAGGEGVAYHDNTAGNQGDAAYRTAENVDIFVSNDTPSGSLYVVKNLEAGEWLAYTISVPTSGNYDIDVRAATNVAFPNSAYHVEIDGTNATGTVVLPDTGGWDNYQWLGKKTVALTAGTHVLRLVSEQPYFSLNSLRVLRSP